MMPTQPRSHAAQKSGQKSARAPKTTASFAAVPAGVASRMVAQGMLHAVLYKRQTVEQAWEVAPNLRQLEPSDQGFVRQLVLTALRHHGQHQALMSELVRNPLPERARPVELVLLLGLTQLLWLGTPAHAAVHTAVELVRCLKLASYAGLVNAVLQRVVRETEAMHELAARGVDANVPLWMGARLRTAYGAETLHAMLQAHMIYGSDEHPSVVDISAKSPAVLDAFPEAQRLPNGSARLTDIGRIERLDGYAEGGWWVQDAAASMPAQWLCQLLPAAQRVLDVCAAPGGKTAQLAAAGHTVVALDSSAQRLGRLRENMERLQLQAEIVTADATVYVPPEPFDAVLLDAPCSATGTLRRHPELAWQRTPADVARLVDLQARLLRQAHQWLKPQGVLMYATCSLLPEEGEAQIAQLLAQDAAWERVPMSAEVTAALGLAPEMLTAQGELRLLPQHWLNRGGLDGFFAACLRRKG